MDDDVDECTELFEPDEEDDELEAFRFLVVVVEVSRLIGNGDATVVGSCLILEDDMVRCCCW